MVCGLAVITEPTSVLVASRPAASTLKSQVRSVQMPSSLPSLGSNDQHDALVVVAHVGSHCAHAFPASWSGSDDSG